MMILIYKSILSPSFIILEATTLYLSLFQVCAIVVNLAYGVINYIPNFFFLKYGLCEFGLLKPILEVVKPLFLAFMVIVLGGYFKSSIDKKLCYCIMQ